VREQQVHTRGEVESCDSPSLDVLGATADDQAPVRIEQRYGLATLGRGPRGSLFAEEALAYPPLTASKGFA